MVNFWLFPFFGWVIGNSNWKEENGFNFRLVVLEIGKLFQVDLVFLAGEFLDLI